MTDKTKQKISEIIRRKFTFSKAVARQSQEADDSEEFGYGELIEKPQPSPFGEFPELTRANSL